METRYGIWYKNSLLFLTIDCVLHLIQARYSSYFSLSDSCAKILKNTSLESLQKPIQCVHVGQPLYARKCPTFFQQLSIVIGQEEIRMAMFKHTIKHVF